MMPRSPSTAWRLLAVVGVMVSAANVQAFHPFHQASVYRSRTVIRGGGFAPAPVPLGPVVVPTTTRLTGGSRESAFVPFGSESFFLPRTGAESFFVPRVSTFRDASEGAFFLDSRDGAEGVRVRNSGGSTGGNPPALTGLPNPSVATTTCPEILGRLDKIETRLTTVETRLKGIEEKVDRIVGEREQKIRTDDQKSLAITILEAAREERLKDRETDRAFLQAELGKLEKRLGDRIDGSSVEQKKLLVELIDVGAKPLSDRKAALESLRKKLDEKPKP